MTASPGREVDANLLLGAAPGSALPRAGPQDAGGQDLGDLVEAFGRGHQVWIQGLGHGGPSGSALHLITYRPAPRSVGQRAPLIAIAAIPVYQRSTWARADVARGVVTATPAQSPIPAKRENASNEGARRSAS
jgi:hypothetical protein